MQRRNLRAGFTTGACAAAAALGAARMLAEQRVLESVELFLPAGFTARFALHGQRFEVTTASCYVIKDAGDDPDVTHGAHLHATVRREPRLPREPALLIEGGKGIGRVTKPGLAVPPGDWAINPVPRQMIEQAVLSVLGDPPKDKKVRIILSIPDGEERAEKTLNARLGILGGLSLLGTTGIVQPLSHRAWTQTLEVALDVAQAAACDRVVLCTGRTSEKVARQSLEVSEEAYIMMGDFVAYALDACHHRGFSGVILAAQFAKLVKIACGNEQTHVRHSRLDLDQLLAWGRNLVLDGPALKKLEFANTAREIFEAFGPDHPLIGKIADQALDQLRARTPGADLGILLADYRGGAAGFFGPARLFAKGRKP